MANIILSAGVRQNLLALQNTADLMSLTQNRLATGKEVNTALDNPTNFFTSAKLQSRSGDLNALFDSMTVGIKTLEAADNGITSLVKHVETMQSTLRQAREDKSFPSSSFTLDIAAINTATNPKLSFSGGAIGSTAVNVALPKTTGSATAATFTGAGGTDLTADPDLSAYVGQTVTLATADGNAAVYTFSSSATGQAAALETALEQDGFTVTRTAAGLTVERADGRNFTIDASTATVATAIGIGGGATTVTTTSGIPVVTATNAVDTLVTIINNTAALADKVRATNDNGKLRIQNLSTQGLTVGGATSGGIVNGGAGASTIAGNDVRANLATQFSNLRDQLNKFVDDASFNGINLLRGDKLTLTFNESGTSTIEIQAKDKNGRPTSISALTLDIPFLEAADLDSDDDIDSCLDDLKRSLDTLRSHASNFGSNLSIVENRTNFTKSMINTLQTGADALVLADSNEEGANLLALQTRQQLSTTALSLAAQADQAVLRLFG